MPSISTLLSTLREQQPLVQCITNYVAMNTAANVLLATGASPAMVHDAGEAAEFARLAGAVTINIGTLSSHWLTGMLLAAQAANETDKPWVLDPVAHFATQLRQTATAELLALNPTIIRGNASEIIALAGGSSRGKGVDSQDSVAEAEQAALQLAKRQTAIVAVTGEIDFVTDGQQAARLQGGSILMPKVTALGCSLTCLIGAFAALAPKEPFTATIAALACFKLAGEQAEQSVKGTGSFYVHFLDALTQLQPALLATKVSYHEAV